MLPASTQLGKWFPGARSISVLVRLTSTSRCIISYYPVHCYHIVKSYVHTRDCLLTITGSHNTTRPPMTPLLFYRFTRMTRHSCTAITHPYPPAPGCL